MFAKEVMRMEAWMLTAAGWVFAPVCSALVVALVNSRKNAKTERERAEEAERKAAEEDAALEAAIHEILKALARQMIIDAYEKYIIHGEHLTIARYEELLRVYEAYKALGGNGTAEAYMREIIARKPYLVTD